MLSREDFVFTIGYDGPTAVVDNQAKRKYGKLSTRELAEKGLFRAAYSSAVYSKDPKELILVARAYMRLEGPSMAHKSAEADLPETDSEGADLPGLDLSSLDRLFGVFPIEVDRAIYL